MFAGELAKPSSLSLGAFEPEGGALIGYLVISRYVDAWHVMNLAVTPPYRRHGVARALLDRLFEVTASDERRGYTLEVRVSNEGRSSSTSAWASSPGASGAATTRTTARTP